MALPWRTAEQVEIATLNYVDWYNHQWLYEVCGDIRPAELGAADHSHNTSLAGAGWLNKQLNDLEAEITTLIIALAPSLRAMPEAPGH